MITYKFFSPILFLSSLLVLSCGFLSCDHLPVPDRDFRADMRDFVIKIGQAARLHNPDFIIIPQNGQDIFSLAQGPEGPLASDYAAAVQGCGREDLFYGFPKDGDATPASVQGPWLAYLALAKSAGVTGLSIDYVKSTAQADDALARSSAADLLCFPAFSRMLDTLPEYPTILPGENNRDILSLGQASNFGYIINPSGFASKAAYIDALSNSAYDILIIDAFDAEGLILSPSDLSILRNKAQGGARLLIAYMSIGEAESYRWYWNQAWKPGRPAWLYAENPDWEGNYKVFYWEAAWQDIILGFGGYLSLLQNAGFDGAYLDIIDAFEYFESIKE